MKSLFVILVAIVLVALPAIADQKRPNILFILVDDQSPLDLKVYRPESKQETPNIDRIAAEGMVLDGAYHMGSWSGAVCLPSRTMIMTGRTVWHIPNRGNRKSNPNNDNPDLVPPELARQSMPSVFNRAGYDTMRTCKNGNSYEPANELFSVRLDATKRGGTPETGSAWHGDQVMNYLEQREQEGGEDPFLIYYGFSHPHDTRDGTPEFLEKYGATNHDDDISLPAENPKQPALPGNWLPEHPFPHGHPGLRDEVAVSGVWENRDPATIRNELGREFACNEYIDDQIGRVLGQLEKMGELENTYIFYTADHGMAIGRHGLQGKQNLYDHTWKVPFLARGPGIEAGSRAEGNIYLLDVLATMCDLTEVEAPSTSEGTSFKPVLLGEKDTIRDVLYGVYAGGTKPGIRSVKKGGWKLIQWDAIDGEVQKKQLFNVNENPHEFLSEHHDEKVVALSGAKPGSNQIDLSDDPDHADKLAEMEKLLLSEMRRLNDPYRLWDQPDDDLPDPNADPHPTWGKDGKMKKPKAKK